MFLARDRLGIRPLFYTIKNGTFYFASEIKSLFAADSSIPRAINPEVLSEIFTFWTPVADETIFQNVKQIQPGHWAKVDKNCSFVTREYWDVSFPEYYDTGQSESECSEQLRHLLIDAVKLRLRADVPVGAYLSGGIDSSTITSLIHHFTKNPLKTFSVTFPDRVFDERQEQNEMVRYLNTDHHTVNCSYGKIAESFPEVIWHTECPILRTAPTPLYLLSNLVRDAQYKVVLTGEGADEILGGYDIFKEAKIRAFIQSNPDSAYRPLLLKRLYPYLALSPTRSSAYAKKFFDIETEPHSDPFFAHRPRWKTTEGTKIFLSDEIKQNAKRDLSEKLIHQYSRKLDGFDALSRAQYIETKLLLANYLLSSQGDRMAMAHSVEGRFPFLDHRVVEFACTIPPHYRMKVLNEKNLLKLSMKDLLPPAIIKRKKQPYMAPDIVSFFDNTPPGYLDYYLSRQLLVEAGLFNPDAVENLLAKCRKGARQGFRENMAFVGILSTQILYDKFIKNFHIHMPPQLENIKVIL